MLIIFSPKVSSTQGLLMKKKVKFPEGKIKVFVLSCTGQNALKNANKWLLEDIDYWYKSVIAHMTKQKHIIVY